MLGRKGSKIASSSHHPVAKKKKWQIELEEDAQKISNISSSSGSTFQITSQNSDVVFSSNKIFSDDEDEVSEIVNLNENFSEDDENVSNYQISEKSEDEKQKKDDDDEDSSKLNGTKRKRYAWMDSDDEDITSSSEDEEKTFEDDEKEQNILTTKNDEVSEQILSTEVSKIEDETGKNSVPTFENDVSDLQNSFTAETNVNEQKDMLEEVRFAYVSNISWEAKLSDLATWLEQNSDQKIISMIDDVESFGSGGNHFKKIGQGNHKGRVFIEFENFMALQQILQLNERLFMGRPLRVIKAYKRENQCFLLQTPAHYRFFHHGKDNMKSGNIRPHKTKIAKVDGGFNWSK